MYGASSDTRIFTPVGLQKLRPSILFKHLEIFSVFYSGTVGRNTHQFLSRNSRFERLKFLLAYTIFDTQLVIFITGLKYL